MKDVLTRKLQSAHEQSVHLYLRLQELEMHKQQIHFQQEQIKLELTKLDGDIRTLDSLKVEVEVMNRGNNGE